MRENHSEDSERRERILREAKGNFLKYGYEETTVDRIAAAAKVGKQAIYKYFQNKEDLFSAVILSGLGQPMPKLDLDEPVAGVLGEYVTRWLQLTSDPSSFGLMRVNIMAYRHFPALAAELHLERRRRAADAAAYFAALHRRGDIVLYGMDVLDLATRLGGLATHGIRPLMGFFPPKPREHASLARWAVEILLHGYREPVGWQAPVDQAAYRPHQGDPRPDVALRLRAERFDELCSTALDLFLEHGFDGMSLDTLIAATGVSRATIYRQFGSKEGLFRYVIERELSRVAADRITAPDTPSILSGMIVLARVALERHLAERTLAMYRLLIREVQRVPDLARRYYDLQCDGLREPLTILYQQHGGGAADDCCVRAFHTLATFGARYLVDEPPANGSEIEDLAEHAARIMLTGVVKDQSSPSE